MNLRRILALGIAGLAATLALSACGFNYPTDRINNLTVGGNDRSGTVNVLNATVVSKKDGSGTFIAGFANNDPTHTVRVTRMSSTTSSVSSIDLKPFGVPPNGLVNLAGGGGPAVVGSFTKGQVVHVTISYDNGETSSLDVPVVDATGQWEGLDTARPSPKSSGTNASPSASPSS